MEFPNIGKHCSQPNCNKLDFLPIKCDVCSETFCNDHFSYLKHNCSKAYQKDNQVPVCPLCNKPIPIPPGQEPDRVVGAHIDDDCQSDPAKNKRKVFTNKCSRKGCKIKEVIPVLCSDCALNYCLKHRHPQDHQCQGQKGAIRHKSVSAALSRQMQHNQRGGTSTNGTMTEDEALARALALSMQETSGKTQEQLDLELARQLQEKEYQNNTRVASNTRNKDRCSVL